MWGFFIKNNRFSYLFLIALIAIGGYSIIQIPKESAPEVIIPIGIVTTVYSGTPATDIENLITNEIERGLNTLENVKKFTSTSREGVSSVVVEFDASADLDKSIQDLKDRIDIIKNNLPTDASDPSVTKVNFVDQPILTLVLSAPLSDIEFTNLAKEVETEIENVNGVSRIESRGVRNREISIIVNQEALVQYNLSINEIIQALRNANLTFPIGQIKNDGILYNIAFEGDIIEISEIPNIGITTRGNQPIYIRDVATVENGLAQATTLSRLSINGQPSINSISIDVYKQSGGDITKITKAVNEKIDSLKTTNAILDNIETITILDAGENIKKDLIKLSVSGLQTVILVIILLVIAIGWREGLLAGMAIPFSFLFGFIGLYFSGNTINFLSLFSLILGIGILVDSAIVMVEGINRKMKENPQIDKKIAATEAIADFSSPLISGTLTTVSMFVGLFIVSGVTGQFIASIPFTLIFLLFASLFVSLAIIPLLASSFLHRRSTSELEKKQLVYTRKLENWYRTKLTPYIENKEKQRKFLALLSAGLVLAISLVVNVFAGLIVAPLIYTWSIYINNKQAEKNWSNLLKNIIWYPSSLAIIGILFFVVGLILPSYNPIKVTFFAQSDVDFIIVEIEQPEGTTKEVTDIAVRRVEEILYNITEIESFTVTVGSGSQFGSGGAGEKLANIFITLKEDRQKTSTEITTQLEKNFSVLQDIKVSVNQPSEGPPTGAAIVFKFMGEDMNELTKLGNQASNLLKAIPNTTNVKTSTTNNSNEFVFTLDQDKTSAAGLNPFSVSQLLRTAVYGTKATSITTLQDDIDVVVKLNINNTSNVSSDEINITSVNALEQIIIPTPTGSVPLSNLITTSLRESNTVINHEDGKRVVTVTADASQNGNAREIQALALEKIESELNIPDNIFISTGGGETDESNKAFMEMFIALIVGVILMLAILVLQFNSYLHTRYVLSILPYSLIGIMSGLAITFNPLSFPSIMGFIALSGIVVNNSILLIDMMNNLRRKNPQRDISEIVLEASSNRLRPILLTTITTVIGMIPLTYAGDLWAPLAYAVMFGLIFSVIITLVLIPILYVRKPGDVM